MHRYEVWKESMIMVWADIIYVFMNPGNQARQWHKQLPRIYAYMSAETRQNSGCSRLIAYGQQ